MAKFSFATYERFKDKSGEWQDRTGWHNVLAWQLLAEIVGEYVHRGDKLYIEATWEDRNSGDRKYQNRDLSLGIVLLGSHHAAEPVTDDSNEERESVHAGSGEITDLAQVVSSEAIAY